MIGLGTIANVAAIIIGSIIGYYINDRFSKTLQESLMTAIGVALLVIGISGVVVRMLRVSNGRFDTQGTMLLILSLVIGTLLGEWWQIDLTMAKLGTIIRQKMIHFRKDLDHSDNLFIDGFVSATLITCIGAMAVIGSLQDGLTGDSTMLLSKSLLDLITCIVLSASLGIGVLFAALPVGVYQGTLTLLAYWLSPFLTAQLISDLSLVGSALITALALNLLWEQKIRVANMLPALLVPIVYSLIQFLVEKL